MNPFEMVVLIIAIVTVGKVLTARYGVGKGGRKGRQALAAPDAVTFEDGARMKAEIDRLSQRLAVLERLATDPSKRLSDQIDALGRDR